MENTDANALAGFVNFLGYTKGSDCMQRFLFVNAVVEEALATKKGQDAWFSDFSYSIMGKKSGHNVKIAAQPNLFTYIL